MGENAGRLLCKFWNLWICLTAVIFVRHKRGMNLAAIFKFHLKVLHYAQKSFKSWRHVKSVHSVTESVHSKELVLESNQVLSRLCKSGRIDDARLLFGKMPEQDEFSWNTMIAAYANSGNLTEAKSLFDGAPVKGSVTWNSLISGYSKYGFEMETVDLFWRMQVEGQRVTQYTVGSLLKLCSDLSLLRRGKQVHGCVIKNQLDGNEFVVTGLVDMYAKCRCLEEAEFLFLSMCDKKNYVMWTAMITGYSKNGSGLKAMKCFRDMKSQGMRSNQFTLPSVLSACAAVEAADFGAQVHGYIVTAGLEADAYVVSSLVDMYARCRALKSARMLLEKMKGDDVVSWNSLICGYVRQGCEGEALSSFQKMHKGGMKINEFTYPSVIKCLTSLKDTRNAESVYCLVVKTGFEAYKHVANALVDMYAKHGYPDLAFTVFKHMPYNDVISWTSLVTGCAHNGCYEEALKLFCDMRIAEVYSDHVVFATVFGACAELTVLEFGRQVHSDLIKLGHQSSLSVDNSLLTFYTKCGCIEDANLVFEYMQRRDVITWTALIVGHAQNGRGKDSIWFYEQMLADGIRPDFITFIGLLFACSHAGLLESAHYYFDLMTTVYGITPGLEHYACMIDLLGRHGKLHEAETLLDQMDMEPDTTIWKALLAACRVHGNLELAERAAKSLTELEPANAVPYIMLSNMFCAAGKWGQAARIRRTMKLKGISKEPGCSWIQVKSETHAFVSEDRSHPRTVEIYLKINEMIELIKKDGYVVDTNFALHDTDKDGKELSLAFHSEKLAAAFGLLTLPAGAPVRIFKNLRICGDCHMAMKCISRVYGRKIILRDSNCFHHFREGKCSCGDYW